MEMIPVTINTSRKSVNRKSWNGLFLFLSLLGGLFLCFGFCPKHKKMSATMLDIIGIKNVGRCETASMMMPDRMGPTNPDTDTPMANQEKMVDRSSGLLDSPRCCCIDKIDRVKPVPTSVALTNNGAKSAVSYENMSGKRAPTIKRTIPVIVGEKGPDWSTQRPIRTEISIGIREKRESIVPIVNVEASLSIAYKDVVNRVEMKAR